MTVDTIVAAITNLTEMYAKARLTQAFADQATSHTEAINLTARAAYWDTEVEQAYAALTATLHDALPAAPETFMPVRVLANGHLEIHARNGTGHAIVTRLTAAEALAVGMHLVAYAAIGTDRTGDKISRLLPPLPTAPLPAVAPPRASTPTTDTTTAPDAAAAPSPARGRPPRPTPHHRHRPPTPSGDQKAPDGRPGGGQP